MVVRSAVRLQSRSGKHPLRCCPVNRAMVAAVADFVVMVTAAVASAEITVMTVDSPGMTGAVDTMIDTMIATGTGTMTLIIEVIDETVMTGAAGTMIAILAQERGTSVMAETEKDVRLLIEA